MVSTTSKKTFAPFKKTEDGSYLIFGQAATAVAEFLGMETTVTGKGTLMLKLSEDDFEAAKSRLEESFQVKVEAMKKSVKIKTFGGQSDNAGGLIFGDVATVVAAELGIETSQTKSDKPQAMVRLTLAQVDSAKTFLEANDYLVEMVSDS